MIRTSVLGITLLALAFVIPVKASRAAIVTFSGQLTSGSGILGDVPPVLDFSLELDFIQNAPGFATINSGLFSSSPANITINGGDIVLIENGSNDQALFAINTTGPTGSLAVTFAGDAIANNQVTNQNLVDLINASGSSTISANFAASGSYTGSVTSAVPEPSSTIVLVASGFATVFRRRRRAA